MKLLFACLCLFVTITLPAMEEKQRYKDVCFEVEVLQDIVYGHGDGYWTELDGRDDELPKLLRKNLSPKIQCDLPLTLDIYQPVGDTLSHRPTVMLMHGGAYFMHSKKETCISEWCRELAARGYMAVSINYRLGFKLGKNAIERAGYRALQDAHSAMRFLVANAEAYRIDTARLFVGGSSSGAINALNLVFMDNTTRLESSHRKPDMGDIETTGNGLSNTFTIKGIIDMWGAVNDISILDKTDVPILAFQSIGDQTVPFRYDYSMNSMKPFNKLLFNKIYGTASIAEHYSAQGRDITFFPFQGDKHSPQKDADGNPNDNFYFILDKIVEFLCRLI